MTMDMVEVKSLSGIVGERRQYILTKIRMKNITVFNRWDIDYNEDYRVRRDNILTLIGMKKITVFNRRYIDHNRDYKGGRKKY